MIGAMARHRVQALRAARKTLKQVVVETGVSQGKVQRIERERPIDQPAEPLQADEGGVGRPSVVEPFRGRLAAVLAAESTLPTVEILHRLRGWRLVRRWYTGRGCLAPQQGGTLEWVLLASGPGRVGAPGNRRSESCESIEGTDLTLNVSSRRYSYFSKAPRRRQLEG
jgi:hypothetical protein